MSSLSNTNKAVTIKAAEGVTPTFDMPKEDGKYVAIHNATVTFEGITFEYGNANYVGLAHAADLTYNSCTIEGKVFLYAKSETFNDCTFKQTTKDYNVWTYGAKNVKFNSCTFNCVGKSVLVYNEGTNTKTDLTVKDTKFIASAPVEGKAAIEIDTSLMKDGTTIKVTNTTADGFAGGSNSKSTLWNDKKQTEETNKNTTVTVNGEEVFAPKIAEVGGVVYPSLEAAFAKLNAENHTLKLLNESAWAESTPVYWKAGDSEYTAAATLAAALTAAYMANGDNITIVCRPGADVGAMTHGHVADNITIYGNKAYLSGGECDLEVDTYMFSRDTGKQVEAGGVYLDKNITINAYELDNLGVWGERHTTYEVNVNLTGCDGKEIAGKENVQRVYINGTTGVNNITLTGCNFLTAATAVYSDANGAIVVDGCSFTGTAIPVNINHKAGGDVTVEVKKSTFTKCGDKGEWKNFAAPIRFVNSGSGTMKTTVDSCTFEGTVGKNGDILIGDGRAGKVSNDLSLTVKNTHGWVQAQKPGRYDGNKVDTKKRVATEVDKDVGLTTSVKSAFIKDTTGTRNDPYTLEQLSEMTRAEYIAAQKRLGDIMYVTVGNYEYDTNGVLGNGVRNDTLGQKPDHSRLNSYAENGYLGEGNDDANGKNIVFVNGSITSNVYGYTDIDRIGTSLLLAVPAYTNVTFEGITFNNVMSFDYQLYTSPWSQLGELKFKNCVFEGIIVGAIAAQELTFDGCRFEDYENLKSENSSNPTWIRPAYGNWTKGDNEGQGTGFRSLTKITFTNNTVTSTRPVKFERIAQWEMATTVTATGNTFTINKVQGDTDTKNVGMYFGANAKFDLVVGNNTAKGKTAGLYTAVYSAPNGKSYAGLPAGSTVKDASGNNIEKGVPALEWKSTKPLTLKTTEEVAQLTTTKGVVKFATLEEAINAATNGDTVTLLKDVTEDVTISKGITLDLGGKTLTNTNAGKATISVADGVTATVKNGSVVGGTSYYNIEVTKGSKANLTLENVTATAGNTGSAMIDNFGTLTINSGSYTGGLDTIKNEPGAKLTISGGEFTLTKGTSKGFTGVVFNYGDLTITGGTFTQSDKSAPYGQAQVIHTDKSGSSAPSTVITGGTFKNLCTKSTAWVVRATNAAAGATQVSGGTFNKKVSDSYLANGHGIYNTGNGKYEAMTTRVAKIDYKYYETLEGAVNAATPGQTVTLVTNVTIANQLVINKKLTLNLNKKTLTSTYSIPQTLTSGADRYALVNNAELTIKNGMFEAGQARAIGAYAALTLSSATVTQKLSGGHACVAFCADNTAYTIRSSTIKGAYAVCSFANNATINISKSELIGTGNTLYHNGSNYGLKLTVKDTTITSSSTDSCGVYISGSTDAQSNTANQNGAGGYQEATFTNCTISGANGVEVKYTDLTLDNCTVEATVKTPSYTQNNNGPAGVGFAVVSTDNAKNGDTPKPEGKITVTGENGHYIGPVGLGSLESVKTGYPNFADKTIDISAGTFSCAVPEDYCADGFIPTKNADDTYGVKAGKYVAEVKGTKYETLQEAVDAARNTTVKMLADTKENVTITAYNVTLDLNGFTLNGGTEKGKPALKIDNTRVTVKDSSENMSGIIMREDTAENSGVSSHYVIDIQGKNGFLLFQSGNVKNNSGNEAGKGASLVRVGDDKHREANPTLTIAGGTFTQENFIAIKVDFGTLHLKGGTVSSKNSYAVENWRSANIKENAVVNGTVSSWVYSTGAAFSKLEISGGTVNGDVASVNYDNAADKQARISITGGEVTGTLGTYTYNNGLVPNEDTSMATIEVTGGVFNRDPSKYVTEDAKAKQNSDGKYGVERVPLAKIGDTEYLTMDKAFHAVKDGETITLLRNYTTNGAQNSGSRSFTIDLNGHTWTYTGTDTDCAAFEINYSNVTLTVKNGTVVSGSMVGLIPTVKGGIKYDNAGLVFENVEMTANGHSGIETNGNNTNDTVTLKNSTLNVPNGFGIYFPSSGTLTIDNSTINAKTMGVQVCAGSLIVSGESTKITVTGDAVPKTENDGAIQDGAAISIVNRIGYKGLETVKINEGTFVAKAGNQAIKAYDWANKDEREFTQGEKVTIAEEKVLSSSANTGVTPMAGTAWVLVPGEKVLYAIRQISDCEAEINGTYYLKLQDAIDAAQNGATVVLVNDVDLTKTVVVNKTITLDMNGKKLHNTNGIWNDANRDWSLISVRSGDLTITGNGTLDALKDDCYAVDVRDNGKLTIENGKFVGNISAVYNRGGEVTIKDGDFSIKQLNSNNVQDGYGLLINCYDESYKNGEATITITGGTFQNFDPMNNQAEGVGTSFVAAGVGVDHVDGKFTAKSGMIAQVVDADGKSVQAFEKLSDALTAAKAGQTVKLLNDVANETFVMVKAGVTLDLAGKNITGATMLYVTGTIVDTAASDTKGAVSAEAYMIASSVGSGYTPVYNGTGYQFYKLGMNIMKQNASEDSTTVVFAPKAKGEWTAERNAFRNLLASGYNVSKVQIVLEVEWGETNTHDSQRFAFNDQYVYKYATEDGWAFSVTMNGLNALSGKVTATAKIITYGADGREMTWLSSDAVPLKGE